MNLFYDSLHQDLPNEVLHLFICLLIENLKFHQNVDFSKIHPLKKGHLIFKLGGTQIFFFIQRDLKSYEDANKLIFIQNQSNVEFLYKSSQINNFWGENELLGVKIPYFGMEMDP